MAGYYLTISRRANQTREHPKRRFNRPDDRECYCRDTRQQEQVLMHNGDGNEDRSNNRSDAKQAHLCRNGFHLVVGLSFIMIPIESYPLLRKLSPARLDWLTRPNSPRENKIRKESATQLDRHSLKPENTFQREGQLKYRASG